LQEKSVITRTVTAAVGAYAPGHVGELTRIVDFDLVDAVLKETGTREKRLRLLPSRVVVYFVLAVRNEVLRVRAGGERPLPLGRRSGLIEAEGSLTRGSPGRAGSSPDKAGTDRHCQTVRARRARPRGAAEANQWLKPRKSVRQ
jgi:hypothetical protein